MPPNAKKGDRVFNSLTNIKQISLFPIISELELFLQLSLLKLNVRIITDEIPFTVVFCLCATGHCTSQKHVNRRYAAIQQGVKAFLPPSRHFECTGKSLLSDPSTNQIFKETKM